MSNLIILNSLRERICSRLGDVVDKVILFGSRIDGTSREDSDYDILVILNIDFDWNKEREIYDLCYDVSLDYDILIDVKVISSSELHTIRAKQPYIQNALESGLQA
jgi:uncharacterized protein